MRKPYQSIFVPFAHPGGLVGFDGLIDIVVAIVAIVVVVRRWVRRLVPWVFGLAPCPAAAAA